MSTFSILCVDIYQPNYSTPDDGLPTNGQATRIQPIPQIRQQRCLDARLRPETGIMRGGFGLLDGTVTWADESKRSCFESEDR
jgi:hypothetical protein